MLTRLFSSTRHILGSLLWRYAWALLLGAVVAAIAALGSPGGIAVGSVSLQVFATPTPGGGGTLVIPDAPYMVFSGMARLNGQEAPSGTVITAEDSSTSEAAGVYFVTNKWQDQAGNWVNYWITVYQHTATSTGLGQNQVIRFKIDGIATTQACQFGSSPCASVNPRFDNPLPPDHTIVQTDVVLYDLQATTPPTVTPTLVPTNTPTPTPSPTGVPTPTVTPTPAPVTLQGNVNAERRGTQSGPRRVIVLGREDDAWWGYGGTGYMTPHVLTAYSSTVIAGIRVYAPGTQTLLGSFSAVTNGSGDFDVVLNTVNGTANLGPGTYDIVVKGSNTLSNKKTSVTLPGGRVSFGQVWVGDSNGSDTVNGADISFILPAFLTAWPHDQQGNITGPPDTNLEGDPNRDFRFNADTNKDWVINGADISALLPRFLRYGPQLASLEYYMANSEVERLEAEGIVEAPAPRLYLETAALPTADSPWLAVDLRVDTAGLAVDTVDAYLAFDPALLELVDAAGAPAAAVELSADLAARANYNVVDNAAGTIDLSVSRGLASPDLSGSFTMATLWFWAKAPVEGSEIQFVQTGARWSDLYAGGNSVGPFVAGAVVAMAN